jgi:shikimate dehydrogenase
MVKEATSAGTKLCGIIGDPIEHTMSPAMQNAAFKKLGLDYLYLPFRVKSEDVGKAIDGMRVLNIRGLNVTIPHKVSVIPLLDKLDPLANAIGAVNTIVNDDGVLTGYNTDATGFIQTMVEGGIDPKGKNVVVLGAGGASRAVSFVLAERGASLVILNRQLELDWAQELASWISNTFGKQVEALELNDTNLATVMNKTDILVNATSVGMSPKVYETPLSINLLKRGLVVFDIVYNPAKTRLLREAEMAGAETLSGLNMLVWQGALAFEVWTGLKAPVEVMRAEVIKGLARK